MPVGVPKVPYTSPEEEKEKEKQRRREEEQEEKTEEEKEKDEKEKKEKEKEKKEEDWVDLYNRLYLERVLFLGQEVKAEIANQIMGLMTYLSMDDSTRDLFLFINSPGGLIISGVGIYDMMQSVVPDVHTICMGVAASMGSFVLVGGEITKRLGFPHARIMIHQPASAYDELRTGETAREMVELLRIREVVAGVYAQRTGQPAWVISEDLERDAFMSADEARAYGILDLVGME